MAKRRSLEQRLRETRSATHREPLRPDRVYTLIELAETMALLPSQVTSEILREGRTGEKRQQTHGPGFQPVWIGGSPQFHGDDLMKWLKGQPRGKQSAEDDADE